MKFKNSIHAVIRLIAFLSTLFMYFICILICAALRSSQMSRIGATINQVFSKITLKILGIKVETFGFKNTTDIQPTVNLYTCNHISYIDIPIISSVIKGSFVTSTEVRDSFFLGWVAKAGGAFFVERKKNIALKKDRSQLALALEKGQNIILFPEATSSDGSSVLPFRSGLLSVATELPVHAHVVLQPLSLSYDKNLEGAQNIGYYGDHHFFSHFMQLLTVKKTHAKLVKIPYQPTREILSDRKNLAKELRNITQKSFIEPFR